MARDQGQRVVEDQQELQTVSDPLLGWTTVAGRQFSVRRFRDMKGTIAVDSLDADALTDCAVSAAGCWPKDTSGPSAPR